MVIVGAGFGGLFAALELAHSSAEIVVVDRHNYHLFQPLLYQVATAALAPSDIAWPIRAILGHQSNTRVLMAEVGGVDRGACEVILGNRRQWSNAEAAQDATQIKAYFVHLVQSCLDGSRHDLDAPSETCRWRHQQG